MGQHWVQDCPTQGDPEFDRKRIRPPVGIPMTRLAMSQEGGLILPSGQTGTLVANEEAFRREILGLPTAAGAEPPAAAAAGQAGGAQPAGEPKQEAVFLLDSKPHAAATAAEKGSPKAGAAAPAVAGSSQLALPQLAGALGQGWGGWGEGGHHCVSCSTPTAMCAQACVYRPAVPAVYFLRLADSALPLFSPAAGEEELAKPSVPMPGAGFFNMFMQSVVLPRGPPEFLVKAFQRDEPLPRAGGDPWLLAGACAGLPAPCTGFWWLATAHCCTSHAVLVRGLHTSAPRAARRFPPAT